MNKYRELKQRQEKELNNFPMSFAFSDKQFKEGMEKLGLTENDTDKVYSIGAGGFIRKEDSKAYSNMFTKFDREMKTEIENDTTGENFIKDMFKYELSNHEYGYTYDIEPTLNALGLTMEEIKNNTKLLHGLRIAKKEYLQACS